MAIGPLLLVRSNPTSTRGARAQGKRVAIGVQTARLAANSSQNVKSKGKKQCKLQQFDYTTLTLATRELQSILPAKVEKVLQRDAFQLIIGLRTIRGSYWLRLCWHPEEARLYLGEGPSRDAPPNSFSFGPLANAQLKNLVLTQVCIPIPFERVARLDFAVRPGEAAQRCVFIEVMGRYSNVILCEKASAEFNILGCGYQVGHRHTRMRYVQVGEKYTMPPPASGLRPDAITSAADLRENLEKFEKLELEKSASGSSPSRPWVLAELLVRLFQGVSPSLAKDLSSQAEINPSCSLSDLTEDDWERLYWSWGRWLEILTSEGEYSGTYDPDSGSYSFLRSDSPQNINEEDTALIANKIVESYYVYMSVSDELGRIVDRAQKLVNSALKKVQSKIRVFEDQEKKSKNWHVSQLHGDLLTAFAHLVQPNVEKVSLPSFDGDQNVEIVVDPTLTPIENAQSKYKRARKLKRSIESIGPLLEESRAEYDYLSGLNVALDALRQEEIKHELVSSARDIQDEIENHLNPQKNSASGKQRSAKPKKKSKDKTKSELIKSLQCRRYLSPNQFEVLVGRNNRQNEVITHSIASKHDLWLHAKGVPGSHVIIRTQPGQHPDVDDIQYAANLAAYFSRSRGSTRAPVEVTEARNVTRAKGMTRLGSVSINESASEVVWADLKNNPDAIPDQASLK